MMTSTYIMDTHHEHLYNYVGDMHISEPTEHTEHAELTEHTEHAELAELTEHTEPAEMTDPCTSAPTATSAQSKYAICASVCASVITKSLSEAPIVPDNGVEVMSSSHVRGAPNRKSPPKRTFTTFPTALFIRSQDKKNPGELIKLGFAK